MTRRDGLQRPEGVVPTVRTVAAGRVDKDYSDRREQSREGRCGTNKQRRESRANATSGAVHRQRGDALQGEWVR